MDKNKQKRERYHPLAVNKVAEMYGFSARYVRQILNSSEKDYLKVFEKEIKRLLRLK